MAGYLPFSEWAETSVSFERTFDLISSSAKPNILYCFSWVQVPRGSIFCWLRAVCNPHPMRLFQAHLLLLAGGVCRLPPPQTFLCLARWSTFFFFLWVDFFRSVWNVQKNWTDSTEISHISSPPTPHLVSPIIDALHHDVAFGMINEPISIQYQELNSLEFPLWQSGNNPTSNYQVAG